MGSVSREREMRISIARSSIFIERMHQTWAEALREFSSSVERADVCRAALVCNFQMPLRILSGSILWLLETNRRLPNRRYVHDGCQVSKTETTPRLSFISVWAYLWRLKFEYFCIKELRYQYMNVWLHQPVLQKPISVYSIAGQRVKMDASAVLLFHAVTAHLKLEMITCARFCSSIGRLRVGNTCFGWQLLVSPCFIAQHDCACLFLLLSGSRNTRHMAENVATAASEQQDASRNARKSISSLRTVGAISDKGTSLPSVSTIASSNAREVNWKINNRTKLTRFTHDLWSLSFQP